MFHLSLYESPLGWIAILTNETAIYFVSSPRRTLKDALGAAREETPNFRNEPNPLGLRVIARLRAYFVEPRRRAFDDLPLDWSRGGEFERRVWRYLLTIPPGESRSYVQIAHELKNPTAARVVGSANRKNPWAIVVPCHRVIGSDGSLRGYAGGLDAKQKLLLGEGVAVPAPRGRGKNGQR